MAKQRQTFNEINITPLTDIFLVLLIIMMVIAPLLDQQGLNLAVPSMVEETEELKETKIIDVVVGEDNKYYIDDNEVPLSELQNTLVNLSKELPDGLLIEAKSDSTHGAIVKLMDIARESGVKSISITEL
ncbi:biopolymer transporter ExbD [bacterium]|nr:biopolymer transporter ExbD [bacterium]